MNTLDKIDINDKEAFTLLIQSIEDDLYNIAKNKLNNINDIEDVIQETVIKIYKSYGTLKDKNRFKAWSIKILLNECNKLYKAKYKNRLLLKKIVCKKAINEEDNSILDFEDDLCFKELLKDLPPTVQDIFIFHYQCNYSIKDIAEILHMKENTVKSKLKRTKIKLEKIVKGGRQKDEK